jgi:hypothetical protein
VAYLRLRAIQPPGLKPTSDHRLRYTQRTELAIRDDTVLPGGELDQPPIAKGTLQVDTT